MENFGSGLANAVADAVGARLFDLPITAEKIHAALENKNRSERCVIRQS